MGAAVQLDQIVADITRSMAPFHVSDDVEQRITEKQEAASRVIDDLELAADQFAELCKADLWPRLVFGVRDSVTPSEVARIVDGAVATFMARYGAN